MFGILPTALEASRTRLEDQRFHVQRLPAEGVALFFQFFWDFRLVWFHFPAVRPAPEASSALPRARPTPSPMRRRTSRGAGGDGVGFGDGSVGVGFMEVISSILASKARWDFQWQNGAGFGPKHRCPVLDKGYVGLAICGRSPPWTFQKSVSAPW